ncbi:winged helix-turn-helix transcriptional regulator [Nannocystis punicea]|uniref:winged helix-turn-helix transcriptional regulator n=1 Tax=Nannocystis punicea TaxID=2995304 RepID=UPI0035308281
MPVIKELPPGACGARDRGARREVFAEVPSRVVYTAAALGLSLRPIVRSLCEWGRRRASELTGLDEPPRADRRRRTALVRAFERSTQGHRAVRSFHARARRPAPRLIPEAARAAYRGA